MTSAGWYPDPLSPDRMRWWDGAKWKLNPGESAGSLIVVDDPQLGEPLLTCRGYARRPRHGTRDIVSPSWYLVRPSGTFVLRPLVFTFVPDRANRYPGVVLRAGDLLRMGALPNGGGTSVFAAHRAGQTYAFRLGYQFSVKRVHDTFVAAGFPMAQHPGASA